MKQAEEWAQNLDDYDRGIAYPGKIDGEMWDKERLREEMLPAIEFQETFNVQIYFYEESTGSLYLFVANRPSKFSCNFSNFADSGLAPTLADNEIYIRDSI